VVSQTGVPIDAGEVLLSLRSRDVWDAVELDRELDESGRVSLLRRVLERLRRDLFEQWFAPLTASVEGEDLVLRAVDEFHQAFLEDNYRPFIDEELRRLVGDSASTDRPRPSARSSAACN
jgi:hypothetical protein